MLDFRTLRTLWSCVNSAKLCRCSLLPTSKLVRVNCTSIAGAFNAFSHLALQSLGEVQSSTGFCVEQERNFL